MENVIAVICGFHIECASHKTSSFRQSCAVAISFALLVNDVVGATVDPIKLSGEPLVQMNENRRTIV